MAANPTQYRVTNVCGTAHLRPCSPAGLNLHEFAAHACFHNTVLTKTFAACHVTVIDRLFDSKIVFLVFSSGVVNAVGAPSESRLRHWFSWLWRTINKHWAYAWQAPMTLRITMVAGVARLNRPFQPRLYKRYFPDHVSWEPEQISALKKFYPGNRGKTTVQAFPNSCNIVSTGSLDAASGQRIAERFSDEVDQTAAKASAAKAEQATAVALEPNHKRRRFFHLGWKQRQRKLHDKTQTQVYKPKQS